MLPEENHYGIIIKLLLCWLIENGLFSINFQYKFARIGMSEIPDPTLLDDDGELDTGESFGLTPVQVPPRGQQSQTATGELMSIL